MAKVRFLGSEPHYVPEAGDRLVEPDEVVTVPDDRFDAYLLNPDQWEAVEEPKPAAEPASDEPPAQDQPASEEPPAQVAPARKTAAAKKMAASTPPKGGES